MFSKKILALWSVLVMAMDPVARPLIRFSDMVCRAIDNMAASFPVACNNMAAHLAARAPPLHSSQKGEINIQGMMMMGVAMIFMAVGFIIYPIILTACTTIDGWEYVGGTSANVTVSTQAGYTTLTGLDEVNGIMPLVVLLGFVVASVFTGFMGIKMTKTGGGKLDPSSLMIMGIGLIFIAVALIIFPVVLTGIGSAYDAASAASFTGLTSILLVTPLIVLTGFMTGGVVAGFFGVKGMAKGASG